MAPDPVSTAARCPFCGDAFPGETECPAHGLALVPPDEADLDDEDRVPLPDRVLDPYDPRAGRGWVALAAALFALGLALPFVRTAPEGRLVATGFQVALERASHLWAVPAVGLWLLSILRHRRTRRRLQGARVAVPMLGLLVAVAVGYTFWRMARGAAAVRALHGIDVPVDPLLGVWLLGAGVLATLVAGFRLGSP